MDETIHATTVLCVRRDGVVSMAGDGQVTETWELLSDTGIHMARNGDHWDRLNPPSRFAEQPESLAVRHRDIRGDDVRRAGLENLSIADSSYLFSLTT